MKVKNISPRIITLRSKKGVDKLLPLEAKVIQKENEEFAKLLIEDGQLKEIVSPAKATAK